MQSLETPKPILLAGDVMQDIYLVGTPFVPQERDMPGVKITSTLAFAGGAGNVQANILAINPDIEVMLAHDPESVSQKARVCQMSDGKALARFDYDKGSPGLLNLGYEPDLIDYISKQDPIVVVSDYGKGAIGVDEINLLATRPLLVDTRDPSKYWKAGRRYDNWVFFPNKEEFTKDSKVYNKLISNGANVVVTWGEHGATVYGPNIPPTKVPTLTVGSPLSVVGAGDVVVAAFAAAISLNAPRAEGVLLGQLLASDAVTRPYTCVTDLNSIKPKYKEYKKLYEKHSTTANLPEWFDFTWARFIDRPGEGLPVPNNHRDPKGRDSERQSVPHYDSVGAGTAGR